MSGLPDSLKTCYGTLAKLIGPGREPFGVIDCAEKHRRYWRPTAPRVILLAESHVYTSQDELLRPIRSLSALPPGLPDRFVRLIYCLGYGEDRILGGPVSPSRNGGTPQFWKVFLACLEPVTRNEDFASIQVARTPFRERIANKISVLERLKNAGVWLVDVSIAALYLPGRPKPAPSVIKAALQASWDGYIRSVVAEATPQAILCIGLGVGRSLRSRLNRLGIPWGAVPQPNARLSSAAHFRIFQTYRSVCVDPDQVRSVQIG